MHQTNIPLLPGHPQKDGACDATRASIFPSIRPASRLSCISEWDKRSSLRLPPTSGPQNSRGNPSDGHNPLRLQLGFRYLPPARRTMHTVSLDGIAYSPSPANTGYICRSVDQKRRSLEPRSRNELHAARILAAPTTSPRHRLERKVRLIGICPSSSRIRLSCAYSERKPPHASHSEIT